MDSLLMLLAREGRGTLYDESIQQKQQSPSLPQHPNIARRISAMAAGLSERLRTRVADAMAEHRRQHMRAERQQVSEARMADAETYEAWAAAARELDQLEEEEVDMNAADDDDDYDDNDNDAFNPALVASRLTEFEAARQASRAVDADPHADADARANTVRHMMHLVRTALSRDVGGISHARIFCADADADANDNKDQVHTGNKYLVERYVRASVDLVQELLDRTRDVHSLPAGLSHRDMLDQLLLARRSYGRTALILSGGSVYGMAHIGVLKALFERRLLPRVISGTSAGSIVAAVICSRVDDEVPDLLAKFALGDLAVFTDKDHPDSWATHIGRALTVGAWHDSRHLARVMRNLLGDMTFQEAFNRTRRILNITVSSKPGLCLPSLLNYLTAPDVMMWSAVVASCSIPGVFDARPLLVRDAATGEHVPWDPAEQLWIDGSLDQDVPVERLGSMLNVNHFIVSQANPHIVLFVDKAVAAVRETAGKKDKNNKNSKNSKNSKKRNRGFADLLYTLGWLGKSEAIYALQTLVDDGVDAGGMVRSGASMLLQMLRQQYTADINIVPRMSLARWGTSLIANPTTAFMLEACRVGEQATWPCVARITQACAVELALDRAVHTLRERIAFSDSQVNLRRFFSSFSSGGVGLGVGGGGVMRPGMRRNHSAATNLRAKKSTSPALTRSGSPTAYRQQQQQQQRRERRGSGGSIQLLARRQRNQSALDTILSEEGSGRDLSVESESDVGDDIGGYGDDARSLAARRGMGSMNIRFEETRAPRLLQRSKSYGHSVYSAAAAAQSGAGYTGSHYGHSSPTYYHHRACKQNSLQQLPISTQTPRQTPRHTPRQTPRQTPWQTPWQTPLPMPAEWRPTYGVTVAPFTAYNDDSSVDVDEEEADVDDDNDDDSSGGDADTVRRSNSVPAIVVQQSRAALVRPAGMLVVDSADEANEPLSDEEDETDDDMFMTRLK